jgi:uracil-DNA glycosylase
MNHPEPTHSRELAREFASALAWWQAAGVDCDYHDDATAWLAEAPVAPAAAVREAPAAALRQPGMAASANPERRPALARVAPPAAPPLAEKRDLLGESPPADLAAFRDWWMNAPQLATAGSFPRIAPRGPAGASLMILVPQPEEADRTALLEGPQGRFLARILAAMGLGEDAVAIAAALPCHTTMADLAGLAAGGMDAVTLHHIGLVAPQRLLVLGTGLAPMLGAASADSLREINHAGHKVPVMASETLDALMDMPRLKARFWRRWMEWSATH